MTGIIGEIFISRRKSSFSFYIYLAENGMYGWSHSKPDSDDFKVGTYKSIADAIEYDRKGTMDDSVLGATLYVRESSPVPFEEIEKLKLWCNVKKN